MPDLTRGALEVIGFVDVGAWYPAGESIAFKVDGEKVTANEVRLDTANALYAFVQGDAVRYIGVFRRRKRDPSEGTHK